MAIYLYLTMASVVLGFCLGAYIWRHSQTATARRQARRRRDEYLAAARRELLDHPLD